MYKVMDYNRLQKVCISAILQYGTEPQLRQLQEECSELAVAISHYIRGREHARDEMIEELADVYICVQQAISILQCFEEFHEAVDLKVNRLDCRLGKSRVYDSEPNRNSSS